MSKGKDSKGGFKVETKMKSKEWRFGNLDDSRCRQNSFKPIDRKGCIHNCRQWDGFKCRLGYHKATKVNL